MSPRFKTVTLSLPFQLGSATVDLTPIQRNVAWTMYVELATRISSQELKPGDGSIVEAFGSLHSLFETTRKVLKECGPDTATSHESVAFIAIRVLNEGVRPFLVHWRTRFSDFEAKEFEELAKTYGGNHRVPIDESKWELYNEFYQALESWRQEMTAYVSEMARVAGISHPA